MSGELRLPDTIGSLPEALAFWAARTPRAPALIAPGIPQISYAALWQRTRDLSAALNRFGIGRHDRVVLLLPEGPSLALALLGTAGAAIALPLNAALTIAELERALRGFGAAAAIVDPSLPAPAREYLAQHGITLFALAADDRLDAVAAGGQPSRPPRTGTAPHPRDIAIVNQTSGTTGNPKRVPRTHGGLATAGRSHRNQYHLHQWDRGLVASPLTLTLGTSTLCQGIAAGAALILPPLSDVSRVWDTILETRPTWMQASAGFLDLLARFLRGRNAPPSSSLRFVRVTAAAMAPAVCEELASYLGAPVLPSYSTSETGRISMALPPPALNKPASVGKPVQEVLIVAAEGSPVETGIEGEIWVRGPRVFSGYLDDPEVNATVLMPGGWFRTGDLGYLDADGFLFLTGRLNELINRGGDKIAPLEVDDALLAHPAVAAAAAFAVPDERLGEDIAAAVVLAQGREASPRELRRWMLERLAPHKTPRRIWFVDELPLTPSGKVQRGELRRLWRETHG